MGKGGGVGRNVVIGIEHDVREVLRGDKQKICLPMQVTMLYAKHSL